MRWSAMTEWRPDKLARRLPALQARAHLQAAIRQWFASEGFVEVETPILQVAPGAEVHLTGFATDWELPDGEERRERERGPRRRVVVLREHREASRGPVEPLPQP